MTTMTREQYEADRDFVRIVIELALRRHKVDAAPAGGFNVTGEGFRCHCADIDALKAVARFLGVES